MSERIIRESVSGTEAKELLLKGITECAEIVADTMGYYGNNNLFETMGGMPFITSDGWDSLEQLHFEDPVKAMAAEVLKEAARKTRDEVGDQTTTTTVLTQALFQNSLEAVKAGKHSIQVKQELEDSLAEIIKYIAEISVPVTDKIIYDIAKTSAHGDDAIAAVVQEAFLEAGEYGVVSHKRAFTDETTIEHIDGVLVESGFSEEKFINVPETQSVVFDNNPLVLLSEVLIETPKEIIPFFEYAVKLRRDLVIIAPLAHGVKNTVLTNFLEGFSFTHVNPPHSGKLRSDALSDLALVCGATVITGIHGNMFEDKVHQFIGSASKVVIDSKKTIVHPCPSIDPSAAKGKIEELTNSLKTITGLYEKNSVKERISKLAGKILTIKVGGYTHSETEERMARYEDAIEAVKSAKEEGVVAGGGIALRSAAAELMDIDDVMFDSIIAPLEKILDNAGVVINAEDIDLTYPRGIDVRTGDIVDMFQAGVLDSAKGIRCALTNAVSASNNLLRTNNVVTLKRSKNG